VGPYVLPAETVFSADWAEYPFGGFGYLLFGLGDI